MPFTPFRYYQTGERGEPRPPNPTEKKITCERCGQVYLEREYSEGTVCLDQLLGEARGPS